MVFPPRRIAVVGATGPTGIHLVRELGARGKEVVAVSRNREKLGELFGEGPAEIRVADALDREATGRAVSGCDLAVDCIGLPPERMADHPRTAAVITEAAGRSGARCLQISSYWSFFPQRGGVIGEDHAREGGHEWFRFRREAEDVMLAAGAAVVHLPDFFGPHVHTSTVQNALREAAAGETVNWLGPPDTPREVAFVPDAMGTVADLAEHREAYGTDWAVPGTGPLTANRLVEIASSHLGRPVELRAVQGLPLRVLSLLHPGLRQFRPMIPQYVRPVLYDSSKLRGLLGRVRTTSLDEAVRRTLDWIERG